MPATRTSHTNPGISSPTTRSRGSREKTRALKTRAKTHETLAKTPINTPTKTQEALAKIPESILDSSDDEDPPTAEVRTNLSLYIRAILHRQYQEVVRAILDKQSLKLERDKSAKELAIITKERDTFIPVSLNLLHRTSAFNSLDIIR